MQFNINSEKELDKVAAEILKTFSPEARLFALYGKMGSGKTTLVKAFCRALNCTDQAVSPTFSIVNEYRTDEDKPIFHFDFYRIENLEEVYDLGYEEYFYNPDALIFVEWAEFIQELMPEKYIKINIKETQNKARRIEVEIISE